MNNAAEMRAAQAAWDRMGPEPTPPEPDYDGYVQDWINGTVKPERVDTYSAPVEQLLEDGPEPIAAILAARNDTELLTAAKALQARVYELVASQAA